jgi:glycolate oxidase iron-sulfur subunit
LNRERLKGLVPGDDFLSQCIHCGMCLSVCPTYDLTKLERSSPRGRIRMIKSVASGEMETTDIFSYEMGFCLDCQACETACPAGVKYGSMVEAARVEVDTSGSGSFWGRKLKKFSLNLLTSPVRLKAAAKLLYYYQHSFQRILHSSGLLKRISPKLEELDKLAPPVSEVFSDKLIPEIVSPDVEIKHKTAFLSGCLMNVMFADINLDTIEVLKKTGCKVYTPADQVCCGSMHAHNGDFKTARKLAIRNLDIFSKYNFDYMITNSAGCSAFMKEYADIFKDDPDYAAKAAEFSAKVKDITEFIAVIREELVFNYLDEHITYHDACHHVHTQKIFNQPREIIAAIPGLKYSPLNESTWCCGSAGTYNILQYETSMQILKRKMENIRNTGADIVLTANPGCYQQIKYGADKFGVKIKVEHPVTTIKKALS